MMINFSTLLISFFVTLALIPFLVRHSGKIRAVDIPNERKVHLRPIPKIGGLAMFLGILSPIVLWSRFDPFILALFAASTIIVVFGFLDDVYELGYSAKFLAQTTGALVIVIFGGVKISSCGIFSPGYTLPDFVAVPASIFLIVGVTNAINLSDGLDGLAGGISLLCFLGIGLLAFMNTDPVIAMFALAAIGSIFGFLIYNTHPATVFMGDAGSQLLGFLSITLAIRLTQQHTVLNPIIPILLLGFPILDTATVMIERILRGVSPFKADKNHFHHKLLRLGLSHKNSVLCIYALQSVMLLLTLVFRYHTEGFLLIPYVAGAIAIIAGFSLAEKSGWSLNPLNSGKAQTAFPSLPGREMIIKISFLLIEIGLPALLILSGVTAMHVPSYMTFIAIGFSILILMTWRFRRKSFKQVLRISLYLTIPALAYLDQPRIDSWGAFASHVYIAGFIVVFLFVIATLKYTRRNRGFKSTPMDFLILITALAIPVLSRVLNLYSHTGTLTVMILIMFFGFEVLIGELREKFTWLAYPTVATLLLIGIKGVLSA